jgi:hypothetical protein
VANSRSASAAGLGGKVLGQDKQGVFVGLQDIGDPLRRDAAGEEVVLGDVRKHPRFGRRRLLDLDIFWCRDFLHGFAQFDQLGSARVRMGFELATAGPFIGPVMVVHVAEQKAGLGAVDDDSQIEVDAGRPKVAVLRLIDAV